MCRLIVNLCIASLMSALVSSLAIIGLSLLHCHKPSRITAVPATSLLSPLHSHCCHCSVFCCVAIISLLFALSQLPLPSPSCRHHHLQCHVVTITSSPWYLCVTVSIIAGIVVVVSRRKGCCCLSLILLFCFIVNAVVSSLMLSLLFLFTFCCFCLHVFISLLVSLSLVLVLSFRCHYCHCCHLFHHRSCCCHCYCCFCCLCLC